MSEPFIHQVFARDRSLGVPNSALPFVFWKKRLPESARDGAAACRLFEANGWTGTWVYTVYPFWHFHTQGHEVLACVSGQAVLGFGGDSGIITKVEIGDVCIVPAGVGHKRINASTDFRVAGGYPPGQHGDITNPGDMAADAIEKALAQVALPDTDPITGGALDGWFGRARDPS
ncbi:MAG TPA: hypothetical protein VGN98_08345 [Tianweitania sediminis]|nr:hypothetical protein [Tianweitania sediminis]